MSLFAHVNGLIVDAFAGGGGASTGLEYALQRAVDLGINHDWDALRIHALNHPNTRHMVEDIRDVVPLVATGGKPVDVLWASPDCRHFSRAKGGKPCHPEVRMLPWQVVRWAREARPRLICVENVAEMQTWCPLYGDHDHGCTSTAQLEDKPWADRDPCTSKACHFASPTGEKAMLDDELVGSTFAEWILALRAAGYRVSRWILHAHHYGAGTSRKRLIVVARRDGQDPVCPLPTHGPGTDKPYRTAAEYLDFDDLGESIFDENGNTRHAKATLRRIAEGIMRYVVNAKKPFIVNGNAPTLIQSGYGERQGQTPRTLDIEKPAPTVVAGGVKARLVTAFLAKHYTGVVGHDVTRPIGTLTTKDHHSLVAANLIRTDNTSGGRLRGLATPAEPLRTVTTANGHALVAAFLSTYYGQSVGRAVDEPVATLTTKDRHALVTVDIDGVTYAITDIRMRMLKPSELKLMQGFPASYRLEGSAKLQVRLIGNSVPPQLAEAVVRANTRAPAPLLRVVA